MRRFKVRIRVLLRLDDFPDFNLFQIVCSLRTKVSLGLKPRNEQDNIVLTEAGRVAWARGAALSVAVGFPIILDANGARE